jgi:hypothetical protein
MHSLMHPAYAQSVQAERVQAAKREAKSARLQHPPPVRSRAAYAAGRVARRLDSAAARKAVA